MHDERVVAVRDEFMDVNVGEVSHKIGCLSHSMTIHAINTIMTEQNWVSRVASESVFQSVYSNTGAPLHEESAMTV